MGFQRCKPALIISLKCKISGVNPGVFSHQFSEKVCSSGNSAGTLQMLHWSLRLPLRKAETMSLKAPIATDKGPRMSYWLLSAKDRQVRCRCSWYCCCSVFWSAQKHSGVCGPWEHTRGFPGCSSQQDEWVHIWGHSIRDKPCGWRSPSV